MEDILNSLSTSIGIWGYVILFFYSLGGGFIALLAAGILSSNSALGSMNIILVVFVAWISNFVGSNLLCLISKYQKRDILQLFKKHRRKIALSYLWLKKYGLWIVFIHKYIYGIKTIIPIVIGFSRYSFGTFVVLNLAASLLWALVFGSMGYLMGDFIRSNISEVSYIIPIFGISLILLIFYLISKVIKR